MIQLFATYKRDDCDECFLYLEVVYNSLVNSTTLFSPFYNSYIILPKTITIEVFSCNNQTAERGVEFDSKISNMYDALDVMSSKDALRSPSAEEE